MSHQLKAKVPVVHAGPSQPPKLFKAPTAFTKTWTYLCPNNNLLIVLHHTETVVVMEEACKMHSHTSKIMGFQHKSNTLMLVDSNHAKEIMEIIKSANMSALINAQTFSTLYSSVQSLWPLMHQLGLCTEKGFFQHVEEISIMESFWWV